VQKIATLEGFSARGASSAIADVDAATMASARTIVILPLFSSKQMRADWNEQPACAYIAIFGSGRPRECDSDVIREHRFPCDQISMTALKTPNAPGSAASRH
jgi:hypothetical protein